MIESSVTLGKGRKAQSLAVKSAADGLIREAEAEAKFKPKLLLSVVRVCTFIRIIILCASRESIINYFQTSFLLSCVPPPRNR